MKATMVGNLDFISGWLGAGVGRNIEVYSPQGRVMWEGFVNEVSASLGPISINRGPYLGIANRVYVTYQTIRWNTNPPIGGQKRTTAAANDTDSQARYGIYETYVSAGEGTDDDAADLRDTYLQEFKEPATRHSISLSRSSAPSVTISCLGYCHLLKRFRYFNDSTGLVNASQKVQDVLAADPNSIFSTDYSDISTNTLQVLDREDSDRDGLGVINDVVSRGDASGNRYIFMVMGGRKAVYKAIPTEYEYTHVLSDSINTIRGIGGTAPIPPWDVLPGKWLNIADFLIGTGPSPTDLAQDPRSVFVESVTYTAPYGLSMRGGRSDLFKQKLANFGFGAFNDSSSSSGGGSTGEGSGFTGHGSGGGTIGSGRGF
jgi:hypothetical protein